MNKKMTNEANDNNICNPLAFPMCSETGMLHQEGMTLRDYFAAHALQGLMVNFPWFPNEPDIGIITNLSFQIATAMLKERVKYD